MQTPEISLHTLKDGTPKRLFVRCSSQDGRLVKAAGQGTATWRSKDKAWSLPVDPVLLGNLRDLLPQPKLDVVLRQYIKEQQEKQRRIIEATRDQTKLPGHPKLWDFQRSSVRFLTNVTKGILAHEMGTGKTVIACSALAHLRPRHTIIVCPTVVMWSWVDHLQDWADIKPTVLEAGFRTEPIVEMDRLISMRGNRSQRSEFLLELAVEPEFCLVLNLAQLRIHVDELVALEGEVFIVDEAHRIKNARAQQSKAAHRVARTTDYTWLLTGTPVRTNYDDYYSLLHTIDPVRFSGYWNFVNTYLHSVPGIWGGVDILGIKDETRFNQMLSMYLFRKTKEEVLVDLPKKVYNEYPVPMEEAQQRVYARMEKEFRMYIQEADGPDILYAPQTLQQIIRLRQIALNPAIIGGKDTSGKLRALAELTEDIDGAFLVFTQFRKFIPYIEQVLDDAGITHAKIVGGMSADKIHAAEDALNEGEVRCLIGTIDAMGEAINLPTATAAIFTDISWTPAANAQAEDRIHRMGIKQSPTIIRLYHPDTVDEHIRLACERKQEMANSTVGQVETVRSLLGW